MDAHIGEYEEKPEIRESQRDSTEVRALAALSEDRAFIPSTRMEAHNQL